MSLKSQIGAVAPRWLVRGYRFAASGLEFFQDWIDYGVSTAWDLGSAGSDRRRDEQEAVESRLTLAYHGLEKAPSFPSPRRPFGATNLAKVRRILEYAHENDVSLTNEQYALDAIRATEDYNSGNGIDDEVTPSSDWVSTDSTGFDATKFFSTRHSVRNYDLRRSIPADIIEDAVRIAGTTPSVCNRRSYRAHYYSSRQLVDALLGLQSGNTGFGHSVPALFVITERRSAFVGSGERNQRWVDGGLFAMTLVWALHSKGLGTCFLNWSEVNAQTRRLRAAANIPQDEDVIVMIAVGYPTQDHRVARSPQRALNDIFVVHDSES